jgi:hypothetical protein
VNLPHFGKLTAAYRCQAYFRRGSARERLQYMAAALEDYEVPVIFGVVYGENLDGYPPRKLI